MPGSMFPLLSFPLLYVFPYFKHINALPAWVLWEVAMPEWKQ